LRENVQSNKSQSSPRALLLFLGDPSYDRRVRNFIRAFGRRGWSVALIYGIPGNKERKETSIDGAKAIQVSLSASSGPALFSQYHRHALIEALAFNDLDIVFASDLYSLRAASKMKTLGKAKRLVYDCREIYTELPSVINRPLVKFIWKVIERRALKLVDLLLVTGPHDVEPLFKIHKELPRSFLVRNLPEKTAVTKNDLIRKRFHISPESTLFIYVGGLQQGRGLITFIEAFYEASSTSKEMSFVLLGDGRERAMLEALVKGLHLEERIFFNGATPSEEVVTLLAAADVGVSLIEPISPSYELALPSKVFEYMSASLGVLSSNLRQVEELFAKEPWITFADPAEKQSVMKGIESACKITEQSKQRAQELHLTTYNFEHEIDACLDLLQQQVL